MTPTPAFVRVILDVPLDGAFDYRIDEAQATLAQAGSWVVVPWGSSLRVGLVVGRSAVSDVDEQRVKPILQVLEDAPVLPDHWFAFLEFVAAYYHRPLGEVALPSIPKPLRTPPSARARGSVFARARRRGPLATPTVDSQSATLPTADGQHATPSTANGLTNLSRPLPTLTGAQQAVLARLHQAEGYACYLLHGVTGSGKTEVYLHWLADRLAADDGSQALLLVPEIGLTPQLSAQLRARFAHLPIAILHSDLPDAERAAHWLAAVEGRARLIVGTRLAVLTPLPHLCAIVVDEEHDASYKQQEGVRYSARDLAIALAARHRIPVLLGSATPSLESWLAARRGRYQLLRLPDRVHAGQWPQLRRIDPRRKTMVHGLTPEVREAISQTLARGEQALVFMNRRGFAPVLHCESCGWLSACDHCAAFRVLHRHADPDGRPRYSLMCHHCGAQARVPRACPTCGNIDLTPLGRGTQRLEEGLRELYPAARIARLDRDVARHRGAARQVIEAAHRGEVDLLVGTQMLAKGHDFQRLTCVVVVDADSGLYSADFRAPERLFAVLMQVAGRAGRAGMRSEVIIQTRFAHHPLFDALARYDYDRFANAQLGERQAAVLPPFLHQALVRSEATQLERALDFLNRARDLGAGVLAERREADRDGPVPAVTLFDPVPMPMMRLAGKERAQLLLESASRKALHAFLDAWLPRLADLKGAVRWQVEVDPLEI